MMGVERYLVVQYDPDHMDWVVYEPGTEFVKGYPSKREAVKQAKAWAKERGALEVEVWNQDGSFDGVWQTAQHQGGGYMQGGFGHTPSDPLESGREFLSAIGRHAYGYVRDYMGMGEVGDVEAEVLEPDEIIGPGDREKHD